MGGGNSLCCQYRCRPAPGSRHQDDQNSGPLPARIQLGFRPVAPGSTRIPPAPHRCARQRWAGHCRSPDFPRKGYWLCAAVVGKQRLTAVQGSPVLVASARRLALAPWPERTPACRAFAVRRGIFSAVAWSSWLQITTGLPLNMRSSWASLALNNCRALLRAAARSVSATHSPFEYELEHTPLPLLSNQNDESPCP